MDACKNVPTIYSPSNELNIWLDHLFVDLTYLLSLSLNKINVENVNRINRWKLFRMASDWQFRGLVLLVPWLCDYKLLSSRFLLMCLYLNLTAWKRKDIHASPLLLWSVAKGSQMTFICWHEDAWSFSEITWFELKYIICMGLIQITILTNEKSMSVLHFIVNQSCGTPTNQFTSTELLSSREIRRTDVLIPARDSISGET